MHLDFFQAKSPKKTGDFSMPGWLSRGHAIVWMPLVVWINVALNSDCFAFSLWLHGFTRVHHVYRWKSNLQWSTNQMPPTSKSDPFSQEWVNSSPNHGGNVVKLWVDHILYMCRIWWTWFCPWQHNTTYIYTRFVFLSIYSLFH